MTGPTVLKLGGSVITDKGRPEVLDGTQLDAVVDQIAEVGSTEGLVLVHGGGSFGHHHADERDVTTTAGTSDVADVHAIHGAMHTLNGFVVDRLTDVGISAVPVHPFSMAARAGDGTLTCPTDHIAVQVDEGFVPVLHGDVIAHEGAGVTVVSGDELVVALASGLGADRVGVCSSEPGVKDEQGRVIDRIESLDAHRDALGDSDGTDVSGGMAGKVTQLLSIAGRASVFGPDAVGTFLEGEEPGTTIVGDHSA